MSRGQLSTRNFQNGLTFAVVIPRLPESSFFIQKVNIPQISTGSVQQQNLFNPIPLPGTAVDYSDLDFTFAVQEGLRNWYDFYMWIHGNNFPQDFTQFVKIKTGKDVALDGKRYPLHRSYGQGNLYSNIDVIISSSQGNPILKYTFIDAFPVSLSGIEIDTTSSDTTLLSSTVSFKYSYFTISDEL